MQAVMAVCAERHQVDGIIGTTLTPEIEVVNLKVLVTAAVLAPPVIPLQHAFAKGLVPLAI
jgi:hypothetical protein